jgi:type II secretory pathway component PulF
MPVFQYTARTTDGLLTKGLVDAPSQPIAIRILHDKQLFVVGISAKQEGFSFSQLGQLNKRIKFNEIVNFTRQLSTMETAGLSLPQALTILRNQTTNPTLVALLLDIEHQVVSGGTFGDALAKYPKQFSPTYIALVRAGELSGTLDQILLRLSDTLESQREFRGKVSGAMVYPAIILVVMIAVLFLMMTVVMPKLTTLYSQMNIKLPWTTLLVISMSNFFVHFWWLLLGGIAGAVWLFQRWRKTSVGELFIDTFIFKIPIFGDLQKKIILVDFTRTLAMLVASGIHILEGLKILQNSLGNVVFRNAIGEISKKVEKGFPLGDSFAQYAVFPPIVSQMMKIGEETGKIDEVLLKVSHVFEVESDQEVKGLTAAIEPIIMVILGVSVGFLVTSIIMPIYSLTNAF